MAWSPLRRAYLVALLGFSLSACGGDEVSSSQPPPSIPGADSVTFPGEPDSASDVAATSDPSATDAGAADAGAEVSAGDPSLGLVINEFVTSPDGEGNDWIELLAVGAEPVSLAEFTLIDDDPEHSPAILADIILAPGEFFLVQAMGADAATDADHAPFKLGSGDSLTLSRGELVADHVAWENGAAPAGTSYGRLPDGSDTWGMLAPTPGAPNQALSESPMNCDALFSSDRVVSVKLELSSAAWQAILDAPQDEVYEQGSFVFDGTRVEGVGIRTKGNSSLGSAINSGTHRYPFKVDFNRYIDGLEFCGFKKLVFNNGFKDPTLIREHLAYRLAREMGLKASRTAFVDLSVNDEALGLYLMVEPVDDDGFLEAHFEDDKGDLYKPDHPGGSLQWRGDSFEQYNGVSCENNEDTTDHSAFLTLLEVINQGPAAQLPEVVDVETMLTYAALNTVLVNLDSYTGNGHNYYIYEQEGVFSVIPWDMNEAFGNFNCGCNRDGIIDFMIDEPTCGALEGRPLLHALLQVAEYKSRYEQILGDLVDGLFSPETMNPWIDEAADLIRPYIQADTPKFFSAESFEVGLVDDIAGNRGGGAIIGLKPFVAERQQAIKSQFAGALPRDNNGQGNCGSGNGPGNPGPGGGPGGGGNALCPDGICDAFEQANPEACPEDCD